MGYLISSYFIYFFINVFNKLSAELDLKFYTKYDKNFPGSTNAI